MDIYGLKNCDTCRKVLAELKAAGIADVTFHDFKKEAVSLDKVRAWCEALGWETVLNKRGTTWRGLDATEKAGVTEEKAIQLMAQHNALLKRPIIQNGDQWTVGWTAEVKSIHGL